MTKEVFWIFLHHLNVISMSNDSDSTASESSSNDHTRPNSANDVFSNGRPRSQAHPSAPLTNDPQMYAKTHFPAERPPVPAAPYVGGVEWDATNYLADHLDLLNGLIASLPTRSERNQLREELRASGFERVMGISLRTCKEKLYGGVHLGLRTWILAAAADGWDFRDVRMGPPAEEVAKRVKGSPKKAAQPAPKLDFEAEKVDLGLGLGLGLGLIDVGKESAMVKGPVGKAADGGWV